jgi:hypothetical protein
MASVSIPSDVNAQPLSARAAHVASPRRRPREEPIPGPGELSGLIEPEQPNHSDRLTLVIRHDRQHHRDARAGACVLARDPLRGGFPVDARNGRKAADVLISGGLA